MNYTAIFKVVFKNEIPKNNIEIKDNEFVVYLPLTESISNDFRVLEELANVTQNKVDEK